MDENFEDNNNLNQVKPIEDLDIPRRNCSEFQQKYKWSEYCFW